MPDTGLLSRIRQVWQDRPRRILLVVTDVTRMEGARICVAGYLDDGRMVRPLCGRRGPTEAWLQPAAGTWIVPFSTVELKVERPPRPLIAPHT
jgi:hypothetical protein